MNQIPGWKPDASNSPHATKPSPAQAHAYIRQHLSVISGSMAKIEVQTMTSEGLASGIVEASRNDRGGIDFVLMVDPIHIGYDPS